MNHVEELRKRFAWFLIGLLWLAAILVAWSAICSGAPAVERLTVAALVLAAAPTAIWKLHGADWLLRQISSVAAIGQVMLLVYATAGHPYQPDVHMAFFAMMAVLSGWLDWRIFVTATLAIAAHHTGLNLLYSDGVFPGGSDVRRVLLHAIIVVLQAGALGWIVERMKAAFETSEAESAKANLARLAAEKAERDLTEATLNAALERQKLVLAIADDLEREVAGIARDVFSSVEPLREAARQMSEGARRVTDSSNDAAAAADQASSNVAAVTVATRGLVDSIGEIKGQVGATTRIVEFTTSSARNVLSTVNHLSLKAEDIGQIVALISTIAERTNLLALNASIEAARFGVNGSGFAVVALEVKALASQTSQATSDIQSRIMAIRESGSEAIRAIGVMNATIGSLNDVSASVAAAVTQQDQATADIARSIQGTADEAVSASGTIRLVTGIAAETGSAAGFVSDAADKLAVQASHLDVQVQAFLTRIRRAA